MSEIKSTYFIKGTKYPSYLLTSRALKKAKQKVAEIRDKMKQKTLKLHQGR